MKKDKENTHICPNCDNKIPKTLKINKYGGFKANKGNVWCKTCGTKIK
jgi:hypothetical protein